MNKDQKLIEAARHGDILEVKRLVRKEHFSVNSVKGDYGWTPLMKAVKHGHISVVKFLVEEGKAFVDARNNAGVDALIVASRHGWTYIVRYLLSCKANANVSSNDGRTALMCAAEDGHHEIVKILVQEGHANINAKDKDGYTPLIYAAWNNHFTIVKFLVTIGQIDVFAKCNSQKTAHDLTNNQEIKLYLQSVMKNREENPSQNDDKMGLSEQEDVFVHHNPYKISKTFDTANKVDQALTASRKPLPSIANHGSKSSESSARSSTQTTSLNTAAHSALVTALEYSLTKEKKQNDHLRKELNETKSELQKSIDRAEIIEQDLKEEERSRKMLMHQVAVLSDQILQLKEELQLAKTDQGKLSFHLDEERHYSTIFQQQATHYEESLRHEIALLKEQITEKEVQLRQSTLEYHPPDEGFDSLEECVRAMQSLARGKVFIKKQKRKFESISKAPRKKKEKVINSITCCVCQDRNSDMCAVPCGHLVMCLRCFDKNQANKQHDENLPQPLNSHCMRCKQSTTDYIRIYA